MSVKYPVCLSRSILDLDVLPSYKCASAFLDTDLKFTLTNFVTDSTFRYSKSIGLTWRPLACGLLYFVGAIVTLPLRSAHTPKVTILCPWKFSVRSEQSIHTYGLSALDVVNRKSGNSWETNKDITQRLSHDNLKLGITIENLTRRQMSKTSTYIRGSSRNLDSVKRNAN